MSRIKNKENFKSNNQKVSLSRYVSKDLSGLERRVIYSRAEKKKQPTKNTLLTKVAFWNESEIKTLRNKTTEGIHHH